MNIGVLPVQVSAEFLQKIFTAIALDPNTELEVSLPQQRVTILATGETEPFDINDYKKGNMTNGFDDIDYLLNIKDKIEEFAKSTPL